METAARKLHWENVYKTRELESTSWYELVPQTSLQLIHESGAGKDEDIIDVGGGDSNLAAALLGAGYRHVTVLDISELALQRAQKRLGTEAGKINWIAADITNFKPETRYNVWHDRAVFHFLTTDEEIAAYRRTAAAAIVPGGTLIIGTFSIDGPQKCSGLGTKQYSEESLSAVFEDAFTPKKCFRFNHKTPSGSLQQFVFCSFVKKATA
jgi:2-polyprenyl-3-methyl-5-hydroxy-6-metoxy-1,4-benzoquinol methylase